MWKAVTIQYLLTVHFSQTRADWIPSMHDLHGEGGLLILLALQ